MPDAPPRAITLVDPDDIEGYALLMAIDAARHARAMALNGVHQHADYCQIKVIGKVRIAPKA